MGKRTLTRVQEDAIYQQASLPADAPSYQDLADRYGVDKSTISRAFARAKARAEAPTASDAGGAAADSVLVRLDQLDESALNPRKTFDAEALADLADSIAASGLLQNLVVRPAAQSGRYVIIAGARRKRAIAALAEEGRWEAEASNIPVKVIDVDDADHLALALLENIQRIDPNPMDEADAFAQLQALNPSRWSAQGIAARIGKSDRYVQQRLALTGRLAPEVQQALRGGLVNFTQARELAMADETVQKEMVKKIHTFGTADALRSEITRGMIPVSRAIFGLAGYAGRIAESTTGAKYFADKQEFLSAQKDAAIDKVAELSQEWSWAELSNDAYFSGYPYHADRSDDRSLAGALVQIDPYSGTVDIHLGLVKKPDGEDPETARRRSADEAAASAREQMIEELRGRLTAIVAANPRIAQALLLWDRLDNSDRLLRTDYIRGCPSGWFNGGTLAALAGLVDKADPVSGRQSLRDGCSAATVWTRLMGASLDQALADYVAGRLFVSPNAWHPTPLHPALFDLARQHNVPVPDFLIGDQEGDVAPANPDSVASRVREVLANHLNISGCMEISDDDTLAGDLDAGPEAAVAIAEGLRDAFGLDDVPYRADPDSDWGFPELGIDTVGDLVSFISKRADAHPKAA